MLRAVATAVAGIGSGGEILPAIADIRGVSIATTGAAQDDGVAGRTDLDAVPELVDDLI